MNNRLAITIWGVLTSAGILLLSVILLVQGIEVIFKPTIRITDITCSEDMWVKGEMWNEPSEPSPYKFAFPVIDNAGFWDQSDFYPTSATTYFYTTVERVEAPVEASQVKEGTALVIDGSKWVATVTIFHGQTPVVQSTFFKFCPAPTPTPTAPR